MFVSKMVYVKFLWREKFKGVPLKIYAKKVVRGNAVQIFSNFPAKSLSF